MIKSFEIYLVSLFLKKLMTISLIFLSLVFILSIFDEISFFRNIEINFFFPFLITALNVPSTLFEIFPFIFLISTQFFFLELINKNELEVMKIHGLNNFKIIKILFYTSFIMGLILMSFFYGFSSKLKFIYLDLKNDYSNDNKYLAVVTENGLWLKDEIDKNIYIISANKIENDHLNDVTITIFNKDFDLIKIVEAEKVDISKAEWVIAKPTISQDNKTLKTDKNIKINTHFDKKKINSLFSNLSSLNIFELFKLKADYKSLGYSTNEIKSHLNRLYSFPLYISIMTIFSSIIMFNIKRNKPLIFHVILGIFLSVIIYYFYYLFSLMGTNGNIPLLVSIWLPLLMLMIFILIGLVRINEK
jgi:lipopolysaccharide export system permease protein